MGRRRCGKPSKVVVMPLVVQQEVKPDLEHVKIAHLEMIQLQIISKSSEIIHIKAAFILSIGLFTSMASEIPGYGYISSILLAFISSLLFFYMFLIEVKKNKLEEFYRTKSKDLPDLNYTICTNGVKPSLGLILGFLKLSFFCLSISLIVFEFSKFIESKDRRMHFADYIGRHLGFEPTDEFLDYIEEKSKKIQIRSDRGMELRRILNEEAILDTIPPTPPLPSAPPPNTHTPF